MDRKTFLSLLYQPPETPYRFRIGARVIKSVAAAFFCAALGHFRGEPAFFSVLAAIICMQNTAEKTVTSAVNRTVGTILGGLFGVGVLFAAKALALERWMLLYYAILCLLLIPLIELCLAINKPSAVTLACAAFFSITIVHIADVQPLDYALNRVLDTMLGVLIALAINLLFPIPSPPPAAPDPTEPDDPAEPQESGNP